MNRKTPAILAWCFLALTGHVGAANAPSTSIAIRNDGNVVLAWRALASHTYRIQFKADVAGTNWLLLPNKFIPVCGDENVSRLIFATNDPQRFFRVTDVTQATPLAEGFYGNHGWQLHYQFSVGLISSYTNDVLILSNKFALRRGKAFEALGSFTESSYVLDGPLTDDAFDDHFRILQSLLADERVTYAYPVYTDEFFEHPFIISNTLLVKSRNAEENLDDLFAAHNLHPYQYLPSLKLYFVEVLSKQDHPFIITAQLESDPRVEYAEVGFAGEPRPHPCP